MDLGLQFTYIFLQVASWASYKCLFTSTSTKPASLNRFSDFRARIERRQRRQLSKTTVSSKTTFEFFLSIYVSSPTHLSSFCFF